MVYAPLSRRETNAKLGMAVTKASLEASALKISRIEAFLDAELRVRQHLSEFRGKDGSF